MTQRPPLLIDDPRCRETLASTRIMYTDLDGTLLGRGGSVLTDHAGAPTLVMAEAVVHLNRAGLAVVICSGRNAMQLVEISRILGWSGFIAEMGAVFVRDRAGEISYNLGDWPDGSVPEGRTPYDVIDESGAPDRVCAAFPGLIEYHAPFHLNRLATHVMRGNVDLDAAQAIIDAGHPTLPIDIVDNGIIHPWRHTLVGVETVHIYHIMPRGVNKAQAVAADLAHRGSRLPRRSRSATRSPI
jgi:hypothetical protein